jgi:hypothetical protein
MSALLELHWSTVSAGIVKWKCLRATTAQPLTGRPHKHKERDCWVLKRVARKNHLSSVATHSLGLFFMVRAPLVTVKRHLNTRAYNVGSTGSYRMSIWFCASNFVAIVWVRPFPVSAWQCPCAQSKVHTEMVCWDQCVRTLLSCTEPSDLNPIEDIWDELEHRLRAGSNRPTSVPNLTNARVAEWKQVPTAMLQHLVESLPRRVEAVIAKGGPIL